MRLNHLDLYVPDVTETSNFLIHYFGMRLVEMRGQGGIAILNDDAGLELIISHPIEKFGGADQVTLGCETYHIGFILPSREDVDQLHARLAQSEILNLGEPQARRGSWLFYCTAPGRIQIEIAFRESKAEKTAAQ